MTYVKPPEFAASLIDGDGPRSTRLAALLRHGLDDVRSLLGPVGQRTLPVMIGVPADLAADEQALVRAALQDAPFVAGEPAWFPQGRASAFAAVAAAMDLLRRRSHRFVLVAGVDSLCAPAQISALDRRTQEQARALDIAQQDAQSAQQTTQRLETEFNTWRNELNLVRQAIQDQSHADLQALDELNTVLEQLVPEPTVPGADPFLHDQSHMATGAAQGVRR